MIHGKLIKVSDLEKINKPIHPLNIVDVSSLYPSIIFGKSRMGANSTNKKIINASIYGKFGEKNGN